MITKSKKVYIFLLDRSFVQKIPSTNGLYNILNMLGTVYSLLLIPHIKYTEDECAIDSF